MSDKKKTYEEGYRDGYRDAMKDGVIRHTPNIPIPGIPDTTPLTPSFPGPGWPLPGGIWPNTNQSKCPVCGRVSSGSELYCCQNAKCPSRVWTSLNSVADTMGN